MRKVLLLLLCLPITSFGAAAQTAVTTSGGTTNAVPVYTGSTVLSNSPIFVSGSNVGVGTTTPAYPLDIAGTVALYGVPVLDKTTLSIPSDGVYVIASGGRIHGEYVVSWNESPNRAQTMHLLVNADEYDGSSTLQILENHSYQQSAIMSNFRLLLSQDQQTVYLVMTVGNRNGGTSANVQYFGTADYGASFGGTLIGNEYAIGVIGVASNEGNTGIGTTSPSTKLEIEGSGATYATGTEDEIKLFRPLVGGVSYAQTAALSLGTYNNTGGCCGPQTRLDFKLDNGQALSDTVDTTVMTLLSNGNVGIGTTSPGAALEIHGNVKLTSGSGASITFPDNTIQGTAWNGTTLGGDYAESVDVTGDRTRYEPGDVIVIDSDVTGKFDKSKTSYSRMVAGVYSTKPGLVGRRTTTDRPDKEAEVPMAMMGIVPTKVSTETGPIERGDLLVSSSTPGYAMKGTDRDRLTGAIIGKALAPLKSGSGVIEVLLALQ